MTKWTRSKITMIYDTNPNITLAWLSRASGWTVAELKEVLLEWDNYTERKDND
jgi:hypothetical protein